MAGGGMAEALVKATEAWGGRAFSNVKRAQNDDSYPRTRLVETACRAQLVYFKAFRLPVG